MTALRESEHGVNLTKPFKGRHYPAEVILLCVRWYLRYQLAYEHVAEMMAERGLGVDASCIWRWVQVYGPMINERCHPHLKHQQELPRGRDIYKADSR
jgi:transposase-like protein